MGAKYSKSKEVEKVVNISEYDQHVKLAKLTKKWSPTIEFVREKGEDWFVYVLSYSKAGVIKKDQMITLGQVEDWIERFLRMKGYERVLD